MKITLKSFLRRERDKEIMSDYEKKAYTMYLSEMIKANGTEKEMTNLTEEEIRKICKNVEIEKQILKEIEEELNKKITGLIAEITLIKKEIEE